MRFRDFVILCFSPSLIKVTESYSNSVSIPLRGGQTRELSESLNLRFFKGKYTESQRQARRGLKSSKKTVVLTI
jgi:hypothetical protein